MFAGESTITHTSSPIVTLPSHQSAVPDNIVTPPIARESTPLATPPILESNTVSPFQTVTSPAPRQTTSLENSPVLESATISAVSPQLLSLVFPPVLESTAVNPHTTVTSPTVLESASPVTPVLDPLQDTCSPTTDLLHPISEPQPAVVQRSPVLVGGLPNNSSGAALTNKGTYRSRGKTNKATSRRDSIDGAPDIILSLGPSGYGVVDPPSPQVPRVTSTEGAVGPPTTSSPGVSISTPTFEDSIIPSSQQSLEGCMTIPAEPEAASSATPSVSTPTSEDFVVPSSQQSLEECMVIPAENEAIVPPAFSAGDPTTPSSQQFVQEPSTAPPASGTSFIPRRFHLALREVPTYALDRSDFPAWVLENGRLDRILSVEGGEVWKKLINTWIRQERRLGFGLVENLVRGNCFAFRGAF